MLASIVKYYFEQQGKKVEIVSVMPCSAKKREIIARGVISECITTRELGELINMKNIEFSSLEDSEFDDPFGQYSGGALIFGVTGGVTEAALRYAVYKVTGKKKKIVEDVRYSEGVKEVTVHLGKKEVRLAIVHGLANAQKVMEGIISGEKKYDFVEVMACPGGCVNGGGQSFVDYNVYSATDVVKKRGEALYKKDGDMKFKDSSENKGVEKVYKELFKNDHDLIHELLHYVQIDYNK
jgi:iron only hydrogenase large subunit-like protein